MLTRELTLDEHLRDDGSSETTRLDCVDGGLRVSIGERVVGALPTRAIEVVMDRYGKPLEHDVRVEGPRLDLGDGRALRMLRHRARYDVIARDFLVFERPDAPAIAELSTSIAAALVHLAEAVSRRV